MFKDVVNRLIGSFGSEKEYMKNFYNPELHKDIMFLSRELILQVKNKAIEIKADCDLAIYTDAIFVVDLSPE